MSDDGYFYDDEADDFEGDLFWNDDGEIVLADDLAEHTLPSPVYAEDGAYETMDGYSDWEYYSDDYYDDDPTLLKDNPQEGSLLRTNKSNSSNGLPRGKKRKLAATSDIQVYPSVVTSKSTGPWDPPPKATGWRSSSVENKEKKLYEPGMGERVALLGNWREVFRSSQPFGRQQRNSELGTRSKSDRGYGKSLPIPTTKTTLPQNVELNGHTEEPDANEDEGAAPKDYKRRQTSYLQGPPVSRHHKVVVEIPVQRVNGVKKDRPGNQTGTASKPPAGRKRKASDVEHENSDGALPKPPAKRAASGRVPLKSKKKAKSPPLPSARTTRSRKK
ncbi:hypothetical protein EPUS_06566 [Endocarpon pusillum Z07020]|uniref:Uncharacterized protein n=1 Tax=Endocarpon pusillum (strain Z07020 / HMAS-L-300199) TaxID=1263415 RepID=U1HRH7_ENDPU|nr:uncharacterized protein EPUS_06566 [Endocarpon pusillum Z07020]ERF73105.1 hypothetical protein EPUS_06566 [Endocarpon pusillum Z07020]